MLADPGIDTERSPPQVTAALPARPEHLSGAYPRVFTGSHRGSVESPAVDNGREFVIAVSSVFGGMTLLIAILVIAGTVGLSVTAATAATSPCCARSRRRRGRSAGWSSGRPRRWACSPPRPASGRALAAADWLRDQFVSRGMVPADVPVPSCRGCHRSSPLSAALLDRSRRGLDREPARQPDPADRGTRRDRRRAGGLGIVRVLLGLVALAGGVTLCVVSASVTGDSAAGVSVATVFTLVVAVALLSPLLIRVTAATLGRALAALSV